MAKHTPYIFSKDAKAQAAFYVEALGGEIQSVQTFGGSIPDAQEDIKDKVLHMSLIAGGVAFFMSDIVGNHQVTWGNAVNLALEFAEEEEAHAAFNRLAEGGKVNDPLKMQFWGTLFGQLEDKYGINWMITTEAKDGQA